MFSFIHAPTPCPRGPGPLGASSGLRPTPFPAVPGLRLELGEPARPPLGWALVGRSGQPISQCSRPGVSEAHRPTPQAPPLLVTRPQEPTACPQLPHHTPVRTGSWPCHPAGPAAPLPGALLPAPQHLLLPLRPRAQCHLLQEALPNSPCAARRSFAAHQTTRGTGPQA